MDTRSTRWLEGWYEDKPAVKVVGWFRGQCLLYIIVETSDWHMVDSCWLGATCPCARPDCILLQLFNPRLRGNAFLLHNLRCTKQVGFLDYKKICDPIRCERVTSVELVKKTIYEANCNIKLVCRSDFFKSSFIQILLKNRTILKKTTWIMSYLSTTKII